MQIINLRISSLREFLKLRIGYCYYAGALKRSPQALGLSPFRMWKLVL